MEVRELVYSKRCIGYAFREKRQFVGASDPCHAEVGGGKDDCGHVLQMIVTQEPDVLEVVRLLDVTDGLFDSPSGDVGGHNLPEVFPCRRACEGSQEHHRLLPEPPYDNHMKQLVADVGKPHGDDAVVELDSGLLPMWVERDCVRVTHDA